MFDPKSLINELLNQNPGIKNNQNASEMINCILNNDEKRGVEIANNLLNTYGVSKDDALSMAKKRFHLG